MQDEVLIAGFGRRGHAVGDIPGVRFKVQPALLQLACILCLLCPFHDPASTMLATDTEATQVDCSGNARCSQSGYHVLLLTA